MTKQSDPKFCWMLGAGKEYLDLCAAYDKSVYPDQWGDWAIPETEEQWELITRHAQMKRTELQCEATVLFGFSRVTAEAYWDKALRMGGAIGDD